MAKYNFTYPEIIAADKQLTEQKRQGGRMPYTYPGVDIEAFGDLLKIPSFKREFNKLQEKHKIRGLA